MTIIAPLAPRAPIPPPEPEADPRYEGTVIVPPPEAPRPGVDNPTIVTRRRPDADKP
jgi:hypothetical protein